MTCIVGLIDGGKVIMGADSAASNGWMTRASSVEKLFRRGPFIIGYTSSYRMGQLLHHEVVLPMPDPGNCDERWMVTRFIPAIREIFKSAGYTKIDSNREEGGAFLVGIEGKLFEIESDFQVASYFDGVASVGSGADYALGAIFAAREAGLVDGLDLVKLGLKAAGYYSGSVMPPFTIMEEETTQGAENGQ